MRRRTPPRRPPRLQPRRSSRPGPAPQARKLSAAQRQPLLSPPPPEDPAGPGRLSILPPRARAAPAGNRCSVRKTATPAPAAARAPRPERQKCLFRQPFDRERTDDRDDQDHDAAREAHLQELHARRLIPARRRSAAAARAARRRAFAAPAEPRTACRRSSHRSC